MFYIRELIETVNLATIGTNFIVNRFLDAVSICEGVTWIGAYSRSFERANEFIGDSGGVKAFDSLEKLLDDNSIDALYIASPTSLHAKQAIMALESGKHVFCEKPAASNLKEWKRMAEVVKKAGKVLLEGTRPLFSPGYKAIKDNLYKIGTVRRASLNYCQYSSRYDKYKAGIIENAFRPEFSNGALVDLGIYCIESMVGLFGKPVEVSGKSYILKDSIDAMGSVCAIYEGMQTNISYSKISNSLMGCEIQGEEGTIIYNDVGSPREVQLLYRNGKEERLFEMPFENDLIYELEYFIEAIKGVNETKDFNNITALSLEIIDSVRKQCGIVFPADSE